MANLLTLKAALRDTKPLIWRRLLVPNSLTFWELHFVMQLSFGWENAHLFEFSTGRGGPQNLLTGSPPLEPGEEDFMAEWWRDPRQVVLSEFLRAPKDKVSYLYDLGDSWDHLLTVEATAPLPPDALLPPVRCPAGRRAGPPEDIGGLPGYEMLLDALAEKAVGRRKRMPGQFSGLGNYPADDPALPLVNEQLVQLPGIVAQFDAELAAYQRQLATSRSRPPRA